MIREILLLGDPALYEVSTPLAGDDSVDLAALEEDLRDTLLEFRRQYGAGRAIAAPQIGVRRRAIYLHVPTPTLLVDPVLEFPDEEMMEVLDDCMSFPNLLVKVMRYKRCIVHYHDREGNPGKFEFEGDFAELIQHEYDHLDGILATMRAKDTKAFVLKK